MNLRKHVNSYTGGMNKDLSTSSYKEDQYFEAENMRVIAGGQGENDLTDSPPGNDTGAATNTKGNTRFFRLPDGYKIHGDTTLNDNKVIFSHNKCKITSIEYSGGGNYYYVYSDDYPFSTNDEIVIKGTENFNGLWTVNAISTTSFRIVAGASTYDDETNLKAYASDASEIEITDISSTGGAYFDYIVIAANHGLEEGNTVAITDTTNFNNTYQVVAKLGVHSFGINDASSPADENIDDDWGGTAAAAYVDRPLDKIFRIPTSLFGGLHQGEITSMSDYSGTVAGTVKATCSAGHGLPTGVTYNVTITGNNVYNGIYTVTYIDATNFYFFATWSSAGVGYFKHEYDFVLSNAYYHDSSNKDSLYISGSDYYLDGLVYQGDLNFNPHYLIQAIPNFETASTQKVYWCDTGYNAIRHLNIVYNEDTNNLLTLPTNSLELVPLTEHESISLTLEGGGNLTVGTIQYAYQLYNVKGAESTFSPASAMLNITDASDSPAVSDDFYGGTIETTVNKAVKVTIDTGDAYQLFTRVRLVALEYVTYESEPTVRIVDEVPISDQTITIYDYGNSLGEYTIEEFQFVQNEIIPKTLEARRNYLIAGNYTQESFDAAAVYRKAYLDDATGNTYYPYLDTRAYRWRSYDGSVTPVTVSGKAQMTGGGLEVYNNNSSSFSITPSYWLLSVTLDSQALIDAVADAASNGYTFVGIDLDSIATLQSYIGITINSPIEEFKLDTSTITEKSYDSSNEVITLKGTGYYQGDVPSGNYFGNSGTLSSNFTFYYNYTDSSSGIDVECVLNRGDDETEIIVNLGGSPSSSEYQAVALDNDALNTYNDVGNDSTDLHQFKYQADGSTLGGEGPLFSYTFDTQNLTFGAGVAKAPGNHPEVVDTPSYSNYLNYSYCLDYVGYMRDEIYRFAVVWYDKKLRPSYAYWIGDIRMPTYLESNPFGTQYQGESLYINFVLDVSSVPQGFLKEISGYQIVRARRKNADKTIKGQGLYIMAADDGSGNNYSLDYCTSIEEYQTPANPRTIIDLHDPDNAWTTNPDVMELITPEASFNKEFGIDTANDYVEVIGYTDIVSEDATVVTSGKYKYYSVLLSRVAAASELNDFESRDEFQTGVDAAFLSLPELSSPPAHTIGGETYYARGHGLIDDGDNEAAKSIRSYKGTSVVIDSDKITNSTLLGNTGNNRAMVANYKTDRGTSIYGGTSYTQRSVTEYIPAGKFKPIKTSTTSSSTNVFGGDTFLTYFRYLKLFVDEAYATDNDGSIQTYVTFPVETTINVDWRSDQTQKYITFGDGGTSPDYHLNEYYDWGVIDYPSDYPEIPNLYTFNSVYATPDYSKTFLSVPFDFTNVESFGARATSSDKKITNEYSDSWLKFRVNNYIDANGTYGAINKILELGNKLLFFQDRAIGTLDVLEKETVQTSSGETLSIGSGGVLNRYDYLTTTSGTALWKSVVRTDAGIYYYDDYNRNIRRINSPATEPISELKGLKTFFNRRQFNDVVGVFDVENREILWALHHEDTTNFKDSTLVYNLMEDAFIGFFRFQDTDGSDTYEASDYLMEAGGFVFSAVDITDVTSNSVWKHNSGLYGGFYGQDIMNSTITLIINPLKLNVARFDILEWLVDVYDLNTFKPTETIYSIEHSNSYQTGTTLTSAGGDFKQRLRKWRANILRDGSDKRMKDNFLKVKITLDNSNNYKQVLHPFITNYASTKIQ